MLVAYIGLGCFSYLVLGLAVAYLYFLTDKNCDNKRAKLAYWIWPYFAYDMASRLVFLIILFTILAFSALPLWIRDRKWPEDWASTKCLDNLEKTISKYTIGSSTGRNR